MTIRKINKTVLFIGRKNDIYSIKLLKFIESQFTDVNVMWSISLHCPLEIKDPSFFNCDYLFCFRSYYIVKKIELKKVRIAAINFHPGPPEYRGMGCLNYALFNNEKLYGVTTHLMNEEIDKGEIIDVCRFKIKQNFDASTVLEKTHIKLFERSKKVVNKIFKSGPKSINTMSKLFSKEKWSKKFYTKNDLEDLKTISIAKCEVSKSELNDKLRSTSYDRFQPFIKIYGHKFIYDNKPTNQSRIKVILVGFNPVGHGGVIHRSLSDIGNNFSILGYFDDIGYKKNNDFSISYLGKLKDIKKFLKNRNEKIYFHICIGSNFYRHEIAKKLSAIRNLVPLTIVHPSAIISYSSRIGKGVFVGPGSYIGNDSVVEDFVIINSKAVLEHNNKIKKFSNISTSSTLSGNVTVSEGSFLGAGCVMIPKTRTKTWSTLPAGSVVIRNNRIKKKIFINS